MLLLLIQKKRFNNAFFWRYPVLLKSLVQEHASVFQIWSMLAGQLGDLSQSEM